MLSGMRITLEFLLAWRQILFHTLLEAAFTCELFCFFHVSLHNEKEVPSDGTTSEKVSIPEMNTGILHFAFCS